MNDSVILCKVCETLKSNVCNDNFHVQEWARILGVSRVWLHELCCLWFGLSPYRLIETTRVIIALTMLIEGVDIVSVSKLSGFGNTRRMRNVMRKYIINDNKFSSSNYLFSTKSLTEPKLLNAMLEIVNMECSKGSSPYYSYFMQLISHI